MVLGSNNSLTYNKPLDFISRIFYKFGRCQEIPYNEQYEYYGVRYFDIKVYFDKHHRIVVKNGSYIYPITLLYQMLDYFDNRGDVIIKITLDMSFNECMMDDYKSIEKKFIETCNMLNSIYHNIEFRGGSRKFDSKVLYEFTNFKSLYNLKSIRPEEQSSIYRFVTKWFPSYIGKLNRKYIEKYRNEDVFLILNYVNRQ